MVPLLALGKPVLFPTGCLSIRLDDNWVRGILTPERAVRIGQGKPAGTSRVAEDTTYRKKEEEGVTESYSPEVSCYVHQPVDFSQLATVRQMGLNCLLFADPRFHPGDPR